MSLIQQFLKSFRETNQMEPGLIQKDDWTVWLVNPDGSEVQLGGGSGLPRGWTQDDVDPANVSTEGGDIALAAGVLSADDGTSEGFLQATQIGLASDATAEAYGMNLGGGINSIPPAGVAAFNAFDGSLGATVALDGGGLLLTNCVPDATFVWVTVQAAAPTTYLTPIVVDTTAVTGATYAWDGTAYVKIANLVT